MADLPPRTLEIDGVQIGSKSVPYRLTDLNVGGKPEAVLGDQPRPRDDGLFFGRDRLGGRVITLEGTVDEAGYNQASYAWGELVRVWDAEASRLESGAVIPLRIRMHDGLTVRVFGRPRQLDVKDDPGFSLMSRGRIDFVATFQCVDHYFYSDIENTNSVGIVAGSTSGLVEPLVEPLSTEQSSESSHPGEILVDGTAAAWLIATVYGPITRPTITVVGEWSITLDLTLAYDQFVTVDATPWNRSVRLNGSANVAGRLTASSRRLSRARLEPGDREVVLRGTSVEGTAYLAVYWRDVFHSP